MYRINPGHVGIVGIHHSASEKLKRYFEPEKIEELLSLIDLISEEVRIIKMDRICRDPKDDFLLALAKQSKADYLITGDKDLLEMKEFGETKIVQYNSSRKDKVERTSYNNSV